MARPVAVARKKTTGYLGSCNEGLDLAIPGDLGSCNEGLDLAIPWMTSVVRDRPQSSSPQPSELPCCHTWRRIICDTMDYQNNDV